MSGSWAFCANLWLTDKLGGRWSGHGLVWGLPRGKWSGLEVCCVENGLDWRSAAWEKVWTEGLLRGKRPGLEVCWEVNGLLYRSAGLKWSGLLVGWKLYVNETKYKWMNMKTLSQATKSNRRHAGKYENYALALQHTISIFSDFVSNLFFKFPIFLSDYFVRSILMSNFFSDFFCPITCPFYLNVRFFVQFFLSDFLSDVVEWAIFFVRYFCPIFLSDFFPIYLNVWYLLSDLF